MTDTPLYDADIVLWSEQQAELLRRRAANALDWENLAEEVEAVGRNELRALHSHLIQALLHDLKAEAWPLSRDVLHWRAEARGQRQEARDCFTPSMAQRTDIAKLYRVNRHAKGTPHRHPKGTPSEGGRQAYPGSEREGPARVAPCPHERRSGARGRGLFAHRG